MKIPLETLREVLSALIAHASEQAVDGVVELHHDAFWSVPTLALSNICADPPALGIGVVSESMSQLEKMVNDDSNVVGYGFVWLAEVLHMIGAEIY